MRIEYRALGCELYQQSDDHKGYRQYDNADDGQNDIKNALVNVKEHIFVILRHLHDRNAEIFFEQDLFGNNVVQLGNQPNVCFRSLSTVDDLEQRRVANIAFGDDKFLDLEFIDKSVEIAKPSDVCQFLKNALADRQFVIDEPDDIKAVTVVKRDLCRDHFRRPVLPDDQDPAMKNFFLRRESKSPPEDRSSKNRYGDKADKDQECYDGT